MYQALYRKWRPKLFDDVVGQGHITETLKRQVQAGRTSHAYLFTGTRGTGKTTCAKILAKAVNCEHPVEGNPCGKCAACRGIDDGSILDVVEMDAASNNGVDQVRALRDEAVYSPAAVKKRVYIVDEVHMLSVAAFNSLLKILEEPPEHLMFILATTELHKVPATILSRCQRFSFKRIQAADIAGRLRYVAQGEGIPLTEDGAALLARLADGGMRDALSLLDQCAVSGAEVNRALVLDTLGLAGNLQTAHIMNAVKRGNTAEALADLADLYANGKDIAAVLDELASLTRDLLVRKTAPEGVSLLAGGYDEATLATLEKGMTAQRLLYMLTLLQDTLANLKNSANRRTDAELCLMKLCDQRLEDSPLALSARIARLEAAMASGAVLAPAAAEQPVSPVPAGTSALAAQIPQTPVMQQPAPAAQVPAPELPPEPAFPEPTVPEQSFPEPSFPEIPFAAAEEPPAAPSPLPQPEPQPVRPAAEPVPSSTVSQPEPVFTGDGDQFWLELVPELKKPVGMSVYPFLSNSSMSVGQLAGNTLTIYARDSFAYHRINKPAALETIAQSASALAGIPVRVRLVEGTAPTGAAQITLSGVSPAPAAPKRRGSQRKAPAAPQPQQEDPMAGLLAAAEGEAKGILTVVD